MLANASAIKKLAQSPRAIYYVNHNEAGLHWNAVLDTSRPADMGCRIDIDLLSQNSFENDILIYLNGCLLVNGVDVQRNGSLLSFSRLRANDIVQIIYL